MDENGIKVRIFDIIEKQEKLHSEIKQLEVERRKELVELANARKESK